MVKNVQVEDFRLQKIGSRFRFKFKVRQSFHNMEIVEKVASTDKKDIRRRYSEDFPELIIDTNTNKIFSADERNCLVFGKLHS